MSDRPTFIDVTNKLRSLGFSIHSIHDWVSPGDVKNTVWIEYVIDFTRLYPSELLDNLPKGWEYVEYHFKGLRSTGALHYFEDFKEWDVGETAADANARACCAMLDYINTRYDPESIIVVTTLLGC